MNTFGEYFPRLRIKEAVYTRVEAHAPWGFRFQPYHHTKFGIVTEGECFLDLNDDQPPILLKKGDCYLLTRGDTFRLRDREMSGEVDFEIALQRLNGRLLHWEGNGDKTTVIGGRFIFETDVYPPQLDLLPPLLHFRVDDNELSSLVATIHLLAKETISPAWGTPMIVDRLAEIFVIQALRAFLFSDSGVKIGWLGAVADEKLHRAIQLIHAHSAKPWTLADIAAHAGMSRAVFAARFKTVMGIAPMAYLTRHRLALAQQLLLDTGKNIAQIAHQVGYESEAAFSRVFKREFGGTPGAFRKQSDFTKTNSRDRAKMPA